jgi:hypothetical protein
MANEPLARAAQRLAALDKANRSGARGRRSGGPCKGAARQMGDVECMAARGRGRARQRA